MRLAKDGLATIGAFAVLAVMGKFVHPALGMVMVPFLCLALWFYRDPDRVPPPDPDVWVSPADGKVVELFEAEHPYVGRAMKIGIFMSGFDVHVNRMPAAGRIDYQEHVPGKKGFAIAPKASEVNERFYTGVVTDQGRALIVQIAGIMARRIVTYVKKDDDLLRAERFGMIKLGSKVDLYLPASVELSVQVGDKVKAGETPIGVVHE